MNAHQNVQPGVVEVPDPDSARAVRRALAAARRTVIKTRYARLARLAALRAERAALEPGSSTERPSA
jgi:hypothetical protein